MLSSMSKPSLKSAIESMLTWTSFKINKPAPEDNGSLKNRDIFNIVVTPDRIPKFFIPSLDVEHIPLQLEPAEDKEEHSLERRIFDELAKKPRPTRSKSEACIRKETVCKRGKLFRRETLCSTDEVASSRDLEKAADHSDPATRAALSLPHLSKITTPYGFLTLGESPNIRRKESLFFEHDSTELRTLLSQRKKATCLSRSPSSALSNLQQSMECVKSPATPFKSSRAVSWEAVCSNQLPPLHCTSGSEGCPVKCEKKKFQKLMKSHLSSIKHMRSHRGALDKLVMPADRT
ncbi:hypothetical protein KIL84_013121 [Mauremys mutica]|uniref:Uncharacterized protein n=1 Tax=Mauremys mutica TaxID=74926 RepID=A0A9D3WVC2_9SAUR|nr:hypothetical protein KIL84_013121 [Mauremys mutica]